MNRNLKALQKTPVKFCAVVCFYLRKRLAIPAMVVGFMCFFVPAFATEPQAPTFKQWLETTYPVPVSAQVVAGWKLQEATAFAALSAAQKEVRCARLTQGFGALLGL